jgi:hypothetical protein
MSTVPEVWRNIPLRALHARQRVLLQQEIPALLTCRHSHFLSLHRYFSSLPERFCSTSVFKAFQAYLEGLSTRDAPFLRRYLREGNWRLNQAFFVLREINAYGWHDEFESLDELEELRFIERNIHPAYIKLLEAPYLAFVHLVAVVSRTERGKGTDGLDLFNAVQELSSSPLIELSTCYNNTVRNAIAHGGVTFRPHEVEYRDKKKHEVRGTSEIIALFDDLLDACNGLALAMAVFILTHLDDDYLAPQQLLLEELRAETDSPWWRVEGCLPAEIGKASQLLIYARPLTRDFLKVQYYTYMTAALAELFAPGYDRYFFSLRSPMALPGFAGFSGPRLARIRSRGPRSIEDYRNVREENVPLLYVPRLKLPRVLGRVDSLIRAFQINLPAARASLRERLGRPEIVVRTGAIHRNGAWVVLNGAVVLRTPRGRPNRDSVRRACKQVISKTLSHARATSCAKLGLTRVLPLGFARVSVLERDYRKRRLASFGLGPDLICTVQLQRIARIRCPDIFDSTIEQIGPFRIAWNKAWIERTRE